MCAMCVFADPAPLLAMLSLLPDVLLQLLLHGCTLADRLRFARCSWRTYNACEDPFAFRGCALSFTLQNQYLRSRNDELPIPPPAPRLLRHVSVRVRWAMNTNLLGDPDSTSSARLVLPYSGLSLTELDASAYRGFGPVWLHLLEDNGSQLRSIVLHGMNEPTVPTALLHAFAELPKLQSLVMTCRATSVAAYAALAQFPALTHLRLLDSATGVLLPHVSACAGLRSLELVDPKLASGESFVAFLSSPACVNLTSLVIERFTAASVNPRAGLFPGLLSKPEPVISESDFRRAFAHLAPCLQKLELRDITGIAHMLPAVESVTGLRSLVLHVPIPVFDLSLLASLLATNKRLRCVIVLRQTASSNGRAPLDSDRPVILNSDVLTPCRRRIEVRLGGPIWC